MKSAEMGKSWPTRRPSCEIRGWMVGVQYDYVHLKHVKYTRAQRHE